MYNIVFIEANRIEDDFYSNEESIAKLKELADNILKVNPEATNYIIITLNGRYRDEEYKVNLLKAYFESLAIANTQFLVGPVITRDTISDEFGRVSLDDSRLEDKQYSIVSSFDMENLSSVLHITHGIEYFLRLRLKGYENIVFVDDFDDYKQPLDSDIYNGRSITYLASDKKGLDGFNECFGTLLKHDETLQRVRKNPNE